MTQRQHYIDVCSVLRVQRKRGHITDKAYQRQLLALGRECQEFLLGPVDDLVDMFKEIKETTGAILDEVQNG